MTESEAIDILKHHSFTHEDWDHPKSVTGFLGMLRPFQGKLNEENFHEVMQVMHQLEQRLRNDLLDREMISNLWSICHLSRAWGIDPEGLLRKNNLITESQINLLSSWIECISYTTMCLLEGLPHETAFEFYKTQFHR